MRKKISAWFPFPQLRSALRPLALAALSVLIFGCPASKPGADTAPAGPRDENTVVIRGSNTFGEELSPDLIAEFKKTHPAIKFDIETKATGYGMAALRVGQCDIAAASRAAIQVDLDLAKDANLEMNDYPFAAYTVAIVVHANNPVANLTKDQVREIFTGKIKNWKDVGGPDAEIHIYIRDPISGTYLGFKEIAMQNEEYAAHPKLNTNYTALVTAVAADPNGIGYCGLSQAKTSGVKAVTVDGVEASAATVNSGKYAYARAVRFYTNKAKESQATKDFVQFVISTRGQEIIQQIGFATKP
ncbi:MAG: phosphate ABC transporter substrate-binding protein [Verrucomicrobiota bacterium]